MQAIEISWNENNPWQLYFAMRFRHEWVTLLDGVFPDDLLSAMYADPIGREFIKMVKDWEPSGIRKS